jgi:hypothetical protein
MLPGSLIFAVGNRPVADRPMSIVPSP